MPLMTPANGIKAVAAGEQQPTWYRFVRRLATRANSELALVYVPDGTHDRLAVLKRLPTALATDAVAVEKFRAEARIAALLEHPSIVKVLEVVESPHEDFYTMEYVRGSDMRQLMDTLVAQKRTLPLDCIMLIAIEICGALDYAHHLTDAKGLPAPVVHRELSPSKVLLGVDGTIKLTGFASTSVATPSKARRARTESICYASPERCLGEGTDARSDVFALGVLIYELSTGERLFKEATTEYQIIAKILRGDLPRPSEIRRGYPRELETILMKALARERSQRYQSAAELQNDLENFLWSRWPTASTTALAKLVESVVPANDIADQAPPSREEIQLWLGPVDLAKPFPRPASSSMEPARGGTQELKRIEPKKFAEASNTEVTLGASGARSDLERRREAVKRAQAAEKKKRSNTDLALPRVPTMKTVEVDIDVTDLGTPGARPSALGAPSARAHPFDAAHRHQYQRPEALDEHMPPTAEDAAIIAKVREKRVSKVEVHRAPAVGYQGVPAQIAPREFAPPRMPSPPPAIIGKRPWPIWTIVAIVACMLVGIVAAWAVLRTTHEPTKMPEEHPSPPTDVILKTAPNVAPTPTKPEKPKPVKKRAK